MKSDNSKEVFEAQNKFLEFVRASIKYPVQRNQQNRLLIVPLDFVISKKGEIISVEYSTEPRPKQMFGEFKYISEQKYLDHAKYLINSYNGWIPNKNDGKYQVTNRFLPIQFYYHKNIFTESNIVLNPDIRAYYPDKSRRYRYLIYGEFGCDGTGEILAVIDKEGNPKLVECLQTNGKTNSLIVKSNFLSLGKWDPAIHKGNPVDSFIHLTIYV